MLNQYLQMDSSSAIEFVKEGEFRDFRLIPRVLVQK